MKSLGVRRHIFSGFSRKENRFVYFLFIQLNGIFSIFKEGPWSHSSCIYNYLCNQCLSPLMWVWISIRARCTTLCSSINKTDRHDLTEILLKVALNIIQQTSNPYNDHNIYRLFYFTILSTTCIVQCQDTCYVHSQVKINTSVKLSENIYFVQRHINLENFYLYICCFVYFLHAKHFLKSVCK